MHKKKELNRSFDIPADVSPDRKKTFERNINILTKGTDSFFMFAADQKIEHLNDDFYGTNIHSDANDPEHIFRIAQHGYIGALAIHAGLVARYGLKYPDIPYIIKLNGKTNLGNAHNDPFSSTLWDIRNVKALQVNKKIQVVGIGYTIYLGAEHENAMLQEATQAISEAHNEGLIAILWIYPRAQHITDTTTPSITAGAAGIANALGADFVKIHMPHATATLTAEQALTVATQAAGNTKVICSGGSRIEVDQLLTSIYTQIHDGNSAGCAIGRNIFQRPLTEAKALTKAIGAIVYEDASVITAKKIFENQAPL